MTPPANRRRYHIPCSPVSTWPALPSPHPAGELFKGKHSTVYNYMDTRTGTMVAVKTCAGLRNGWAHSGGCTSASSHAVGSSTLVALQ